MPYRFRGLLSVAHVGTLDDILEQLDIRYGAKPLHLGILFKEHGIANQEGVRSALVYELLLLNKFKSSAYASSTQQRLYTLQVRRAVKYLMRPQDDVLPCGKPVQAGAHVQHALHASGQTVYFCPIEMFKYTKLEEKAG
ncbi:hypothetical protein CTA1_3149 [Colletotrichum tanaceti]|uniref:Uncharacterized protein n=1 Tax=Colletotrichum tanaceti TaxID=1306861 RepID=A0A4U6XVT7_9PEZI|nr:hypothetical protein CTA1_3149 [Colletotrichum tanaceti]